MRKGSCRYFTGSTALKCAAGVVLSEARNRDGSLCCIGPPPARCPLYEEPTEAEIEEFERLDAEMIEEMDRQMQLLEPLLSKIREKYRGRDMHGRATCPLCRQKGALSVAHCGRNGHLHVFCETENCVRFME